MRYYDIFIDDTSGPLGQVAVKHWTSFVNNVSIPGALNVEFDLPVYNYSKPLGGCYLKIHGISLQDISQASNLNGLNIKIYGGMQKGLPLANPAQAGLILSGKILQCFGNWIGTEQTLDFVIAYGGNLGNPDDPQNIVLNWPAGELLSFCVQDALRVAFPSLKVTVSINSALITAYDQNGFFGSLQQFASWLEQKSIAIIGGDYAGVQIALRNGGIFVYDNTANVAGLTKANPKVLSFFDLIGQPTWLTLATLSVKTVMRADLQVGDYVKLPPGPQTTQVSSFAQYRDKSVFQGVFQIISSRHLGNFRQTDAGAWATVFEVAST